jgi:CHAD domain-containing protein
MDRLDADTPDKRPRKRVTSTRPNGPDRITPPRKPRVTTVLLEKRASALDEFLPRAVEGEVRAVHQARVATRRLREAIPVLSAAGVKRRRAKNVRRKLRRLTRAFGRVRELDVTMQILDELSARPDTPAAALAGIRQDTQAERERRHQLMCDRLHRVNPDKLRGRLARIGEALASDARESWKPLLNARLLKRARTLDTAIADAGHIYAPERLHAVRIAAKKLRYVLELAGDADVRDARPLVRTLKRAQEALGHLHDLQVVQRHLTASQAAAESAAVEGQEAILQSIEAECRHLHARYLAALPSLQEATASCRTIIAPQLARRSAKAPRMLKMPLERRRGSRSRVSARRA